MLHVYLPIDTQVTSELSPNNCFQTTLNTTKSFILATTQTLVDWIVPVELWRQWVGQLRQPMQNYMLVQNR